MVRAQGNYELAWSKEGGIIPDKALDQSGVLVIPNLDYSDLGTYTCTGSDATGLHQAQATITFGGEFFSFTQLILIFVLAP